MMGETLAFAKGERRILIRRVYLHTFFEDLAEQLKPELAERGIRLELACTTAAWPTSTKRRCSACSTTSRATQRRRLATAGASAEWKSTEPTTAT